MQVFGYFFAKKYKQVFGYFLAKSRIHSIILLRTEMALGVCIIYAPIGLISVFEWVISGLLVCC